MIFIVICTVQAIKCCYQVPPFNIHTYTTPYIGDNEFNADCGSEAANTIISPYTQSSSPEHSPKTNKNTMLIIIAHTHIIFRLNIHNC